MKKITFYKLFSVLFNIRRTFCLKADFILCFENPSNHKGFCMIIWLTTLLFLYSFFQQLYIIFLCTSAAFALRVLLRYRFPVAFAFNDASGIVHRSIPLNVPTFTFVFLIFWSCNCILYSYIVFKIPYLLILPHIFYVLTVKLIIVLFNSFHSSPPPPPHSCSFPSSPPSPAFSFSISFVCV